MTRLTSPVAPDMFSTPRQSAQTTLASEKLTNSQEHARPLAGMLLAASMAALLVTADQVIDSWADGHLLAAWVALWTVTFAALALLATPLRRLSNTGAAWLSAYAKARQARRQEEEMWELARHDSRVMAEIRMASLRQTQD
ncbi:MAG: hypothetical protein H7293_20470 [Candidatus Saccharibacteria bacterium]|nr:hypothetical protein [Rhodoferax sp.]